MFLSLLQSATVQPKEERQRELVALRPQMAQTMQGEASLPLPASRLAAFGPRAGDTQRETDQDVITLHTLFNVDEPQNAMQGIVSGLKAAGQGILLGPAAAVAGPVAGAKSGIKGCLQGFALGERVLV
jgi:hypothetical protein